MIRDNRWSDTVNDPINQCGYHPQRPPPLIYRFISCLPQHYLRGIYGRVCLNYFWFWPKHQRAHWPTQEMIFAINVDVGSAVSVGRWSFEMQIRLQMSLWRSLCSDAAQGKNLFSGSDRTMGSQQYRIPITKYGKLTLLGVASHRRGKEEIRPRSVLWRSIFIQAIRIIQTVMGRGQTGGQGGQITFLYAISLMTTLEGVVEWFSLEM